MMEARWTVRRVLQWTTQHFDKRGIDAPRLASELLLAHVLGVDRVRLYTDLDRPLHKEELAAYRALIERRVEGEPVQYLTGRREFYGRTFQVDSRALIPRPETELLVEAVLRALPPEATRLLDVATGSGCIAVTLAAERPQATVVATDVDAGCCELARANAQRLGVAGRVDVRQGDLFSPLSSEAAFDVVVSNPPYVPTGALAGLQQEVQREPRLALDGGPEGTAVLARVVDGAFPHLVPGGFLALEIGEEQGAAVRDLLQRRGYERVHVEADLERRDRMAFGTRPRG